MLKQLYQNHFKYQLHKRMVILFICLSFLTTLTLSLVLYGLFSRVMAEKINDNSGLVLRQAANSIDNILLETDLLVNQLREDHVIFNFLFSREENKVLTFQNLMILSKHLSIRPYIHSIELFNGVSEVYVSSAKPFTSEIPLLRSHIREIAHRPSGRSPTHEKRVLSHLRTPVTHTRDVLTLYYRQMYSPSRHSMIAVNLDLSLLADHTLPSSAQDGWQSYILDGDGNILYPSGGALPGPAILAAKSQNGSGHSTLSIEGRAMLATVVRSARTPLVYLSLYPHSHMMKEIIRIRYVLVCVSSLVFVCALLAYIFLSRRIHRRLHRLLDQLGARVHKRDEIETLREMLSQVHISQHSQEQLVKEQHLKSLLLDSPEHARNFPEIHAGLDRLYAAPCLTVVLFQADGTPEGASGQDAALQSFALSNIAEEIFSAQANVAAQELPGGEIALVLCLDRLDEVDFEGIASKVLFTYHQLLGWQGSAAIGETVRHPKELHKALKTARIAMQQRFFAKPGQVFRLSGSTPPAEPVPYPYDLEAQILSLLAAGEEEPALGKTETFLRECAPRERRLFHAFSDALALSILRQTDQIQPISEGEREELYARREDLARSQDIDGAARHLRGLVREVCSRNVHLIRLQKNQRHMQLIQDIKAYTEKHYADPSLSLQAAAGSCELSGEYIARLFKRFEGVAYAQYLGDMRLRRARELLISTDLTASHIGERVGFVNSSYFFTLFKKAYSQTPNVFRESMRAEL